MGSSCYATFVKSTSLLCLVGMFDWIESSAPDLCEKSDLMHPNKKLEVFEVKNALNA